MLSFFWWTTNDDRSGKFNFEIETALTAGYHDTIVSMLSSHVQRQRHSTSVEILRARQIPPARWTISYLPPPILSHSYCPGFPRSCQIPLTLYSGMQSHSRITCRIKAPSCQSIFLRFLTSSRYSCSLSVGGHSAAYIPFY